MSTHLLPLPRKEMDTVASTPLVKFVQYNHTLDQLLVTLLYVLDIKCVTVVYTWCTQSEDNTCAFSVSVANENHTKKYKMKSHTFFLLGANASQQQYNLIQRQTFTKLESSGI